MFKDKKRAEKQKYTIFPLQNLREKHQLHVQLFGEVLEVCVFYNFCW
jgi:hypothetical protein